MNLISLLWNLIIFDPMLNGLILLYAVLGHNFGVTIIVFTIIVRIATYPLTMRQIRSTKKMSELQPKIQEFQRRYGKDRQRVSQETMRLYKESGVNPVGCLGPMVIQFPIWIGLYMAIIQVLPTSPESLAGLYVHLYSWLPLVHQVVPLNSEFLWLDLTAPDPTPILAILVGGSMWVLQKMSMTASTDPKQQSTQRMMLWMMPVMFGFFSLSLPSGLPVYWFASNIIGGIIQYRVTGLSGLLGSNTQPPSKPKDKKPDENTSSSSDKETGNYGQNGNKRQDDRRGNRSRSKGTRRRTRGSRHRGH